MWNQIKSKKKPKNKNRSNSQNQTHLSSIPPPPTVMAESLLDGDLQNLVRLGITRSLFDAPNVSDHDPELEAVIEGANLTEQDVNIWNEPSTIASSSSMLQANYLNPSSLSSSVTRNLILEKLHSGASTSSSSEDDVDASSGHTHTVKAATFNQLVLWLLSSASDSHFRHTFFATLYGFTTPQQFIAKVEQRYTTPTGLPKLDQVELFSIANTMTHWVSSHGHEFSTRVYTQLNKFVENTFIRDGHIHIAESLQSVIAKAYLNRASRKAPPALRAQQLMLSAESLVSTQSGGTNLIVPPTTTLTNTTSGGSSLPGSAPFVASSILTSSNTASGSPSTSQQQPQQQSHSSILSASLGDIRRPFSGFPEPKLPKNIFELSLNLDDVEEEEIARQITTLDCETFHMMKSKELLKNAWLKNRGKKAKRVVLLLNASNALTKWVLDSITQATGHTSHINSNSSSQQQQQQLQQQQQQQLILQQQQQQQPPQHQHNFPSSFGMEKSSSSNSVNGGKSGSPLPSTNATQGITNQLTPANTKKVIKTVTRWLKIAEHLKNLNNFHSLLAIWVALRSRYVSLIFDLLKKDFPKSGLDVRHHPESKIWVFSFSFSFSFSILQPNLQG
jgi:hypothetical protein